MASVGPRDERILVTGGAGFIGSHLADALVENNQVTVYDSLVDGNQSNIPADATLIEADIRDRERLDTAISEVDRIFHQAALVSVERSIAEPEESHEINVTATLGLLDAARQHDVSVVLASSAALYGPPDHLPVSESHPVAPSSPYGLDKLAIDQYARLYHEQYGLDTVALRYFNVYGPRQTGGDYAGVIAAFSEQARAGGPITVEGDGNQTRDFVHVSDIVRTNLLAATTPAATGTAINVGTGRETSIQSLATTIQQLTGSTVDIDHVDPRPGDIPRSVADISRARHLLGYEPSVELEEGLRTIVTK